MPKCTVRIATFWCVFFTTTLSDVLFGEDYATAVC